VKHNLSLERQNVPIKDVIPYNPEDEEVMETSISDRPVKTSIGIEKLS
jgi:hypothetical protein